MPAVYPTGTRRLEEMIADARALSYSEDYSYTQGWNDNVVAEIFNLGLDRLYASTTMINQPGNIEEVSLDTISGQMEYDIPIDIHMAIRIMDVRYLFGPNSATWQFITLAEGMIQDRFSYPTNIPDTYCIRNGKILLSPTPNITRNKSLVINYQKRMRKLDIRRGVVDSFATGPVTFNLIFPTTSQKDVNMKANADSLLDKIDWVTLVDRNGLPIVSAIPVASYNVVTQVLSAEPDYVMPADENAALTAALLANLSIYVLAGDYSSSHSQLDRQCEDHLIEYAVLRLMRLQSAAEPTRDQADAEEQVLGRLVAAYRRYRPSVMPIIFTDRLSSRSWPFGRRGMV